MGLNAIINVVGPLLVGQLWYEKKYGDRDSTINQWYGYPWKAMQAGGVISAGLQALFFPFTFMNLYVWERVAYVSLWVFNGMALGQLSVITVLSYFVVSAIKYEHDDDLSTKNLWITFVIYLAFQVETWTVGYYHFK